MFPALIVVTVNDYQLINNIKADGQLQTADSRMLIADGHYL